VVSTSGATGLDAGPLTRAKPLEAVGYLQKGLALSEQIPWTGGFTVAR
jgi:predicted dinucleotide-binding enzyme